MRLHIISLLLTTLSQVAGPGGKSPLMGVTRISRHATDFLSAVASVFISMSAGPFPHIGGPVYLPGPLLSVLPQLKISWNFQVYDPLLCFACRYLCSSQLVCLLASWILSLDYNVTPEFSLFLQLVLFYLYQVVMLPLLSPWHYYLGPCIRSFHSSLHNTYLFFCLCFIYLQ